MAKAKALAFRDFVPEDRTEFLNLGRKYEPLTLARAGRALVRAQGPLAMLDDSKPEPGIAVVAPGDDDREHPRTALLVVEVADTSLRKDRTAKAEAHAAAGVSDYWIVNLVDRQVEVHRDIVSGAYSRVTPFRSGESLRPLASSDGQGTLRPLHSPTPKTR